MKGSVPRLSPGEGLNICRLLFVLFSKVDSKIPTRPPDSLDARKTKTLTHKGKWVLEPLPSLGFMGGEQRERDFTPAVTARPAVPSLVGSGSC